MPGSNHGICQQCGSHLGFQFQLMSPLIAAFEEAVEWSQDPEVAEKPLLDWEWLTVAFYACSAEYCRERQLVEMPAVIVNESH